MALQLTGSIKLVWQSMLDPRIDSCTLVTDLEALAAEGQLCKHPDFC
ncbi:MAG: hypothetical protein OEV49_16590 [candidate division Zixibacteria bacterium]|nr:hypothetical protein [candidate division Zixibacteria bacterium]MDH3938721.1 hypothetical protein [candidate division Zixibacteria bacterium]MDH4034900.1 hypothetical protein [candidate division Zixibacteria bacterium]